AVSYFDGQWVINVQTENAAIARRIFSFIKNVYKIEIDLLVRKKMKLKKNNVYICRIKKESKEGLEDLKIFSGGVLTNTITAEITEKQSCRRSYLRGAFRDGGSVNELETSAYHLEIASLYEEHAEAVAKLMYRYELDAKDIDRKRGYIIYLKEAEKIAECLS